MQPFPRTCTYCIYMCTSVLLSATPTAGLQLHGFQYGLCHVIYLPHTLYQTHTAWNCCQLPAISHSGNPCVENLPVLQS